MRTTHRRPARRLPVTTVFVLMLLAATAFRVQAQERPGDLPSATPGESLDVRDILLDNGMRLVVLPRSGAPTVSFVARFEVGGVHERLGTTGIAHLLEHLLFKGTESIGTRDVAAERKLFTQMDALHEDILTARATGDTVQAAALRDRIGMLEDSARTFVESNEFDRILTKQGAQGLNATTTTEATTYFVDLPANRVELWFALEADRIANPVFREFYAERDVVTEERRMRIETSPGGVLYEQHLQTAFGMHPYGVPVVGYMSDLELLRRADVESYYRRFYGPNNAVVAIVGDVDPDAIEALAVRYFGDLPRRDEPPAVLAVEPPQLGERRIDILWDAEPQLRIGWHVPSAISDDGPALALLTSLLTGGRTSRLHRRLVIEDRSASGIFTSLGPGSRFPQLLQIDASPVSPATTADIEAAIYEEIERLARDGPTEDELTRVRNQIAAGSIRRIQSNIGLAFQFVESVSLFDDWRETFRYSERLRHVTAEHVQRLAREYLVAENRTVATLVKREGS